MIDDAYFFITLEQSIIILKHLKHIWRVVFPKTAQNSDINGNVQGLVACETN